MIQNLLRWVCRQELNSFNVIVNEGESIVLDHPRSGNPRISNVQVPEVHRANAIVRFDFL